MSDRPIIEVEGLGKRYRLGAAGGQRAERYTALRDVLAQKAKGLFQRRRPKNNGFHAADPQEFWALQDVSFTVGRGEVVGIIGRNGAGKSTLLKILSRITEPTEGRVRLRGRVASLLEVGTGFHPELTGRENIFLNGAILGMQRAEIRRKFDEIVAFAEVEKFLDTPVKRYSSGMYVRLAFAVAAHLEPEILIVDEVLAVGDAEFQKKCLGKMEQVARGEGRTVLFVSHQMNAVQTLCSHCLLLAQGRLRNFGATESVIASYQQSSRDKSVVWESSGPEFKNPYFNPLRLSLVDAQLDEIEGEVRANESLGVLIEGEVQTSDPALEVGFAVYAVNNALLFWSLQTDTAPDHWPKLRQGLCRLVAWLPPHLLNEGDYRIELLVSLHWRVWFCQPEVNAPTVHLQVRGGLSESPHWMEPRPGLLGPILRFESIS